MAETIKIRLRTSVASSNYVYAAGEEVDAPAEIAMDLIKAEYADPIEGTPADTREKAIQTEKREKRKK